MTHAASCRFLTAEAWFRSWACPYKVCGCQIGIGAGFSPNTLVLPCQHYSTSAHLHAALNRKTNRRSLGTFQKAVLSRELGIIG